MALTTWIYPYDITGVSPDNLIDAEPVVLDNRVNRVIALKNGAFYGDSVVITDTGTTKTLTSDQYFFSVLFPQPTAESGQPVYGLIVITDSTVTSNVAVRYQVVGGQYSYSQDAAKAQIDALNLDNRSISWPNLVGVPDDFPPAAHYQNFDTLYGMEFLVSAVYQCADAIRTGNDAALDQVLAYVDQQNANQNATITSVQQQLTLHLQDTTNPHKTTAAQVGAYTTAQTDAAISAAVTPVQNSVTNLTNTVNQHIAAQNNPHDVTAAQVGAYTKAETDAAIAAAIATVTLGFVPVQQGGGYNQNQTYAHKVYIGWDESNSNGWNGGLRAQVDSTDQGHFVMEFRYLTDLQNLNTAIAGKQATGDYVVQNGNANLNSVGAQYLNVNGSVDANYLHSRGDSQVDGTMYCTNDIWAFTSDKRLKDRFEEIDNPKERLKKLRGVFHHYTDQARGWLNLKDDKQYVGFIAQDFEEALPQAVGHAAFDRDENGESISGEHYLTAQYERTTPLLTNVVNLHTDEITSLEREVRELRQTVRDLVGAGQAYGTRAKLLGGR